MLVERLRRLCSDMLASSRSRCRRDEVTVRNRYPKIPAKAQVSRIFGAATAWELPSWLALPGTHISIPELRPTELFPL